MFQNFSEESKRAVDEAVELFTRFQRNGGTAPLGGDPACVRYVMGLLQGAGLVGVEDFRGSPKPTLEDAGLMAFGSPAPQPAAVPSDAELKARFPRGARVRVLRQTGAIRAGQETTVGFVSHGTVCCPIPGYLGSVDVLPEDLVLLGSECP